MRRAVGLILCGAGLLAGAEAKEPERYVRLVRPAVGCPGLDAAAKVAEASVLQDLPSAREAMAAGACQMFKSMRGVVAKEAQDAVCVLAIGGERCLWFEPGAFAPAAQSGDEK